MAVQFLRLIAGAGLAWVAVFTASSATPPATKKAPAKSKTAAKTTPKRAAPVSAKARAAAREYVEERTDPDEPAQIENAAALIPFFERLFRAEHSTPNAPADPVHILHYGDSHTAADEWTGRLRYLFQARFGDGGDGFSLPGRPFRGYRRLGQRSSMTNGWQVHGLLSRDGDSVYGLGGAAVEASRPGEILSLDLTASTDSPTVEVFFLRQPGGGWVNILDEGRPVEAFSTSGPQGPGYFKFEATSPHIELETLDSGPVRVFGWSVDRRRGVTYETLGINGAQISVFGRWEQQLWANQLSRRDPALVVLAYGTNEASNREWTEESYRDAFRQVLANIRAAAPAASILVIGPPDRLARVRNRGWSTFPRMDEIVAAQRAAAAEMKCAFWDWRGRMGGEGAMKRWVLAGFAQADHVHFTGSGYQLLGEVVHRDILTEYARFAKIRERLFEPTQNGQTGDHPAAH